MSRVGSIVSRAIEKKKIDVVENHFTTSLYIRTKRKLTYVSRKF